MVRTRIYIHENVGLTAAIHVIIFITITTVDLFFCWVVSSTLITAIKIERKSIVKLKGRQLQQGAHKGPIRIDTPPPSIDPAASSIFRRRQSYTSKKGPISILSENFNTLNRMKQKSKTLYPKIASRAQSAFHHSLKSRA